MILIILILLCISGFILFSKVSVNGYHNNTLFKRDYKVSIIIPARNEELNLPNILSSLKKQTYEPYEIIVVDDFSTDKTNEIAKNYGVKVIQNTSLPDGWTGKTWAVWNGFLNSSGDILIFLDADVRLSPNAIESLLKARERSGGAISVVPYHYTEKFYERLSLVPYLLGVFAFTSPFERRNTQKGLYGSCIVTTREDYEKINGHESIRCELLDDLSLGKKFSEYGINIENFIGYDMVSFRMYQNGINSEIQGFSKGAVLSTATLTPATILFIALWVLGLFAVGLITPFLLIFMYPLSLPFLLGYIMYTVQIIYFLKYTGYYGRIMPIMHFLSSIFFILIMIYSIYQVTFLGRVSWKGRQIKVRGRKSV
jgi:glycosyltransferase involved in cell wall biosynthesis